MRLTLLTLAFLFTPFTFSQAMDDFIPSRVTPAALQTLIKEMKSGYKPKSQCYNRAHYWAWQIDQKFQIKTMKIFMFFREEFMQIDKFDWWFHVAPAVVVEGETEPWVLDKFLWNGAIPLSQWQSHFLKMGGSNRSKCKVITKYSDYENNVSKEHCYIYFTAPQYLEPDELVELEERGERKSSKWDMEELSFARRQAFWF